MALMRRTTPGLPSIFSDFFGNDNFWDAANAGMPNNMPAVNIKESNDAFHIDMATPGIPKEDIHIQVDDNVLTISGEHREEQNEGEKNAQYTRQEFSYNSFSRSFKLPNMVNTDNIKANCQNGILHLDIPKREEAKKKPKREINVS